MASFWFLLLLLPLLIISFMATTPLPSLASSDSQLLSSDNTPTLPASPVSIMSDPPLSPFQELSPDIAPLFPSPGGVVPNTGSSMPTIPSSPSPPNPDDLMAAAGPGSAFPPFGSSLPPSISTSPRNSVGSLNLVASLSVVLNIILLNAAC